MRGKFLVGLLALIPKPVVVANDYLMGQHTVAPQAQFSGKNYFSLQRLGRSMHTRHWMLYIKLGFTLQHDYCQLDSREISFC